MPELDEPYKRQSVCEMGERSWMMKKLAKIMEFIGIFCFFLGGGAMDEPSAAAFVLILAGMGIVFSGLSIEEVASC